MGVGRYFHKDRRAGGHNYPPAVLVPVILYYLTLRNINLGAALLLFPFFWTGFEYFHNIGQLAFPWIELGNTETYNLNRIQYIDYTGVHGVTFLICVIVSALYYLIHKLLAKKWTVISTSTVVSIIVIIILIMLPNVYSSIYPGKEDIRRYTDISGNTSDVVRAAVVQTNVDPWKKWGSNIPQLMDTYIQKFEDAAKTNPDIIVVHETATPFYFFSDYYIEETDKFINFTKRFKQNLLMGIPHLKYYADSNSAPRDARIEKVSRRRYDTFNSAVLLEPGKQEGDYSLYFKSKLVPVSERMPYQEYLPFLKGFVKWGVGLDSWQIGNEMTIFEIKPKGKEKSIRFATVICFESVFSEYVSEFVKKGAEFLVVITNDGWFGKSSGPYQHQQFAVLRAIENRKWVIRGAQTGISCFIDPVGNIYENTELYTECTITKDIIANNELTFYAAHGDVTGKVSYFMSVIMLAVNGIVYIKRKKYKNRVPT